MANQMCSADLWQTVDISVCPVWDGSRVKTVEATLECTMYETDALRVQGFENLDGDAVETRGFV